MGVGREYDHDEEDRRYEADVQRAIDERWEAQLMNAKRNAAASAEEMTLLDAYVKGRKAGRDGSSPEMNEYPEGTAKHAAWERGRITALAQIIGRKAA